MNIGIQLPNLTIEGCINARDTLKRSLELAELERIIAMKIGMVAKMEHCIAEIKRLKKDIQWFNLEIMRKSDLRVEAQEFVPSCLKRPFLLRYPAIH